MIIRYLVATFCVILFFFVNYLLSMFRWEVFLKEEYLNTIFEKVLIGILSLAITSSIYLLFINLIF